MSVVPAGRLGVLIPCRNEAAVIGRKLANLARAHWPEEGRPHRLLVVDDESDDGTRERAAALCAEGFDPAVVVASATTNRVRPGKNGALCQGLDELEDEVQLVVVTDADVVLDEWALTNLARAFRDDGQLGMACGTQRFVRELRDDGRIGGLDGGAPEVASDRWDRMTGGFRAVESTAGRLFSVHGQILAWRASLGLRPTPGVAADDLDLMLTMRERHRRLHTRRLGDVLFYERKTPPGEEAEGQALRRARAYLQLFRAHPTPPPGLLATVQWTAYRAVPWLIAGSIPLYLVLVAGLTAWMVVSVPQLPYQLRWAVIVLGVAYLLSRVGPGWRRLTATVRRALREERREAMPERWEMRRS